MMKIITRTVLALAALALVSPAFAGGTAGGVEPGAGCEAISGEAFGKVQGAPYSGTGMLSWNGVDARFSGTVTQFGGTAQLSANNQRIPGIDNLGQFMSLRAQDFRRFCILNVEGGQTEFAEVLAASRLVFGPNNTATVEVIVVPLIGQ